MLQSLAEVRKAISEGKTSVTELTRGYLQRIEEKKSLNAFLEVFADEALERSKEIDLKLKENRAGKLAGMVIGIKDNLSYQGHKVSASLKYWKDLKRYIQLQRLKDSLRRMP